MSIYQLWYDKPVHVHNSCTLVCTIVSVIGHYKEKLPIVLKNQAKFTFHKESERFQKS